MTHEFGSNQSSKEKGVLKGCTKQKVFLGRKVGAGELLAKEKKGLFLDQDIFFGGCEGG